MEVDFDLPPSKVPKLGELLNPGDETRTDSVVGSASIGTVGELLPPGVRQAFIVLRSIEVAPRLFPQLGTCPLYEKWMVNNLDSELEYLFDGDRVPDGLQSVQDVIDGWTTLYPSGIVSDSPKYKPNMLNKEVIDLTAEDCTVTLKRMPLLMKALGKAEDETVESTFCLTDLNLPFSKFVPSMELDQAHMITSSSTPSQSSSTVVSSSEITPCLMSMILASSRSQSYQFYHEKFQVSAALVSKVERLWSQHFVPSNVIAVPYKISIYEADQNKFQPIVEKKEPRFIGTFYIGLTDPRSATKVRHYGNELFSVNESGWTAANGTWCAYYANEIPKLTEAHWKCSHLRGVIAFKILAKADHEQPSLDVQAELDTLNAMKKPFGILLRPTFTLSCQKMKMKKMDDGTFKEVPNAWTMKGADAVLFEVLSKLERSHRTQVLPVIVSAKSEHLFGDYYDPQPPEVSAEVFPFTESIINSCFFSGDAIYKRAASQWPKELQNVPFVTTRSWNSQLLFHTEDEGVEFTGDENSLIRPAKEHNIYLATAFTVLPL